MPEPTCGVPATVTCSSGVDLPVTEGRDRCLRDHPQGANLAHVYELLVVIASEAICSTFESRSDYSENQVKSGYSESNRERERREWLEEGERLEDLEEDFSAAKLAGTLTEELGRELSETRRAYRIGGE